MSLRSRIRKCPYPDTLKIWSLNQPLGFVSDCVLCSVVRFTILFKLKSNLSAILSSNLLIICLVFNVLMSLSCAVSGLHLN